MGTCILTWCLGGDGGVGDGKLCQIHLSFNRLFFIVIPCFFRNSTQQELAIMSKSHEILKRRRLVSVAEKAPYWAALNLFSLVLCLFDLYYSFISSYLYLTLLTNIISLIEMVVVSLFTINFAYNIYLCVWFRKLMQPIEFNSNEYELYGIGINEKGFKLKKEETMVVDSTPKKSPKYLSTPPFELSNTSILDKHPSLDSTNLDSRLFDSTLDSTQVHSWSFIRPSNSSLKSSTPSPNVLNMSGNELKFRKSRSFLLNLNERKSAISSKEDLDKFLTEYNERTREINELTQAQKRLSSVVDNVSPEAVSKNSLYLNQRLDTSNFFTSTPSQQQNSFWNKSNASPSTGTPQAINSIKVDPTPINLSSQEISPTVGIYQPAIKVCKLSTQNNLEKAESVNYNHASTKALEKVLSKLDIDDARLNQMVENIRKWISQTILIRLADEIDSINKNISEKGFIDSLIGETSIQQLKHLASTKKLEFPTLEQVCSFLDLETRNIENNITLQQYLVRRLKDLAKGGCITEFLWDGGGSYNYKLWKEDMPTDSEVILHLFCVYMDSRLLFNPTTPEGKPFSSQHVKLRSTDNPKSDTYIHQVKPYPPHYSLVLKNEPFDLPPGRNNLFYALLVFLNHIKVKNFGLLGRINLGPSGLNIAWVIDK